MFDRVWRRAGLFEQMADLLNIDPGDAARLDRGDAIRAAHQRCLECRHAQDCRNWIGVSEGVPLPPSYCATLNSLPDATATHRAGSSESSRSLTW